MVKVDKNYAEYVAKIVNKLAEYIIKHKVSSDGVHLCYECENAFFSLEKPAPNEIFFFKFVCDDCKKSAGTTRKQGKES